jgi:polyketide cyclase/dehydrase/lipid transport protein
MKLATTTKLLTSAILLTASMASFAGALEVQKEITVNASPETTWKMIGDFNHLDVWHPVVVASELTQGNNQTAGAVRVLTLGNGAAITEKLLTHNNGNNSYSYEITESPLPVSGYVSEISVSATEDGKSVVRWTSSFDAKKGFADEEAVNTISGVYDAGLMSLQKHFQ